MLVVGNVVLRGVPFASAAVSAFASLRLFLSVSSAACTRETPLPVVSRLLSALNRACDAAELLNPDSWRDCPGPSATGCVVAPLPSSMLPATEKNAGKLDELTFADLR